MCPYRESRWCLWASLNLVFKMTTYWQLVVKCPHCILKVMLDYVPLGTHSWPDGFLIFGQKMFVLWRLTGRYRHVYTQTQMLWPLSLGSKIPLLFSASCEQRENWNSRIIQTLHTHTVYADCVSQVNGDDLLLGSAPWTATAAHVNSPNGPLHPPKCVFSGGG